MFDPFSPIIMFFFFVLIVFALLGHGLTPYNEEDDLVRPKLKGKDLEQWTALYQSLAIFYQRNLLSENGLAEIVWDRWSELTGKEQWIREEKDVKSS